MLFYVIGGALVAIGLAAHYLWDGKVGGPVLVAGALLIGLHAVGAIAADIPVPISRPLTMSKAEKHALRDLVAKQKMTQRQFERSLLSSAGKGRLE